MSWATAELDALACTAPPEPSWFAAPQAIWSGLAAGAAVAAIELARR